MMTVAAHECGLYVFLLLVLLRRQSPAILLKLIMGIIVGGLVEYSSRRMANNYREPNSTSDPLRGALSEHATVAGITKTGSLSNTSRHCSSLLRMTSTKYTIRQVAPKHSLEYRAYLASADGRLVSPFHDVPLYADQASGILNMIVEVPRFSNAKLEISKDEWMNPIKQDIKKGALRFVKNCFPYHGYLWNYGAFPQTWESPAILDHETGLKGDNDPIDVIEIGSALGHTGQVKQVKVLGALAMLDEGETDWKIIAIDVNDPLAGKLDDCGDIERVCPGLIEATRRWFRVYKIPDGKPANSFAFDGAVKDKAYALKIIQATNIMWKELIEGRVPSETKDYKISVANKCIKGTPGHMDGSTENPKEKEATSAPCLSDNPVPESAHDWAYIPVENN